MDISVIIPVYNSSATLEQLAERLNTVLTNMQLRYELIFVDDDSADQSWTVLQQLQHNHPDTITAVQLMRNFGQHNAIMCGLRLAQGKYVVTLDDDLQNPPEEIPKLYKEIENKKLDLVYGFAKLKQHSAWRNLGTKLIRSFYKIVFKNGAVITSFRIIKMELVQSIFSYDLNFTQIDGLLAWNSQRIGNVIVEHHTRATGSSGYSISKLVILSLNLFTNFSLLPLQLLSALGIASAVFGFTAGSYYILSALIFGNIVPGYASTITAILTLGGMQLLALGMIGEYIGRLHMNVNRKPQYTVRQITGPSDDARDSSNSPQ
jgi:glycosyltransferase involved in cell wall biosynthesis